MSLESEAQTVALMAIQQMDMGIISAFTSQEELFGELNALVEYYQSISDQLALTADYESIPHQAKQAKLKLITIQKTLVTISDRMALIKQKLTTS